MRPCEDSHSRLRPSFKITKATPKATTESSQPQPVRATKIKPTTTPAEVQTSAIKCLESAIKAIERCSWATVFMIQDKRPLSAELSTDSVKPQPKSPTAWG